MILPGLRFYREYISCSPPINPCFFNITFCLLGWKASTANTNYFFRCCCISRRAYNTAVIPYWCVTASHHSRCRWKGFEDIPTKDKWLGHCICQIHCGEGQKKKRTGVATGKNTPISLQGTHHMIFIYTCLHKIQAFSCILKVSMQFVTWCKIWKWYGKL